jgi:hypothetical protein
MSESRTSFTAREPVDLLAVVPFLLGFHPEHSVVLLTFGAPETFHARVDLPSDPDEQAAVVEMLAEVLSRHRVRRAALLLYTEDSWCAATFHDAAVGRLVADGVELIDVLRVGRERFHDAGDVDDPGTPYDVRTHRFTAEQVLEGKVVHHDRAELAATLDLVDRTDARAVAEEAERVAEELFGQTCCEAIDLAPQARWVQQVIRRHVSTGTAPAAPDAARLLLLVGLVQVRDVAWAEMSRPVAPAHLELWRDLVRRCPRDLLPGAASLLAFAAWLSGHGALAWCALDRCAAVDPEYSMADCISGLLEGAVPPSAWAPIPESDLPVFAEERRVC